MCNNLVYLTHAFRDDYDLRVLRLLMAHEPKTEMLKTHVTKITRLQRYLPELILL